MSHELRTPLNAILGMTEGLQEGMLGTLTDAQNKALQIVERGGKHLLDLINDILDLAKIEAGQVELNYTTAQISPLCQASTSFVRQQAYKKSIALNVKTPEPDLNLWLDERRIRQVLINLLNNAVKFTPEGGTVTLEVTIVDRGEVDPLKIDVITPNNPQITPQNNAQDNDPGHSPEHPSSQWLRCSVTDTGIGIAPENLDRLFRPFSQIDSALNRHYSGTGLGLALIKHIAELHGGTVGVRSEVGVGSEFWMLIPLSIVTDDEAALPPDYQPQTEISMPPANQPASLILLAEDNAANILTMSNYLEAKGYRIIVAKDGQEAIDVTQSQQVDLILMDIQMPTIDGLEAIGHIRKNPNYATVPIVALTALAMGGDRERCLAAGADDYLAKPVQLKQLVQTIQNLCGRTETPS
jgi:CheY-like chemotaxis protein/nitrogen-specific signal transduction histidine kinase